MGVPITETAMDTSRNGRPRLTAMLPAWLLAAALAAISPAPAAEMPVVTTRPAATVSTRPSAAAGRYLRIVEKLASPQYEGRGPGTKGLELARDDLAARFRAAGLKPAFGTSYTQAFSARGGVEVQHEALAIVPPGGGESVELAAGDAFRAMGFSGSEAFEGEAVFAGYSIVSRKRSHDSYAGRDANALAGKVAVVLRYEPHDANGVSAWTRRRNGWTRNASLLAKVGRAVKHGAAAVLIVNPPAKAEQRLDHPDRTARAPSAPVPVLHLGRTAWLRLLSAGGADGEARAKSLRALAAAGNGAVRPLGVRLRGRIRLRRRKLTLHNVAGVLPGKGALADEVVIVGAHYDHLGYGGFGSLRREPGRAMHPGADDNASGAAGVVMLARRFAAAAPGEPDDAARRTIAFVTFGGEEIGLLGSRAMVKNLIELGIAAENVVAMLNMDMIGRLRGGRLNVWGVDSAGNWRAMVRSRAKALGLRPSLHGSPLSGSSDHISFHRAGIRVLGFNTGGHADLHRPTDTADKINPGGALKVLELVGGIAEALREGADPGAKPGAEAAGE